MTPPGSVGQAEVPLQQRPPVEQRDTPQVTAEAGTARPARNKPLEFNEAVILCGKQLYVEELDSQDPSLTLQPVLRTYTRLSSQIKTHTLRAVKNLYLKYARLQGKTEDQLHEVEVPVEELWDALRTGMSRDERIATDMYQAPLEDAFGDKTTTIGNAMFALMNLRRHLAYCSSKGLATFDTYRKAGSFKKLPAGLAKLVNERNNQYYASLIENPMYDAMKQLYLRTSSNATEEQAEELAKRVCLNMMWQNMVNNFRENDIDISNLDTENPLVGQRLLAYMRLTNDSNIDYDQVRAELPYLKRLSDPQANVLHHLATKYGQFAQEHQTLGVVAKPTLEAMGVDIGFSEVWEAFNREFFAGRTDLTPEQINNTLRGLKPEEVAAKIKTLQGLTAAARRAELLGEPTKPAAEKAEPEGTSREIPAPANDTVADTAWLGLKWFDNTADSMRG
ncbi:hypothetical protein A2291_08045 [candidate division WOR-1 bacterium RIFOXYB2_FULL_42_35]|uniref:Uncharacterized protein n=1 Tax=candidate division WOR-1 bacterium RIFOXYC2_FULL_41_25 TaxID=1802586 RepID=A0A1F4TIA6_UNCSA|nr:MAG: hypothetical protein A2247_01995 [candidate division WOR-1 bacterium RIFOXYA2_FULL_41_14]OGC24038.1 MAG: hypothetical protein A2291_08045 [candidate division WOR-1 bacterium RIFOXYB2_FULL_42_35]OGC32461.1 MAG: hypothetical protein A2462_00145 [candidate division WOR-1 bacterium RIFOXYC2_FULL_41_25]